MSFWSSTKICKHCSLFYLLDNHENDHIIMLFKQAAISVLRHMIIVIYSNKAAIWIEPCIDIWKK